MVSVSKIREWFRYISSPSGETEAANEDIQPGWTPTPANRRIEAKADELAEANRKFKDELQQANELLEAQKKDLADKDVSLQQLEMAMGEIQTKVGRVENGMDFR